jgi:hypothetical protein
MKPQNFEEKVVWYYIIGTYVLYFLGAQFVVAPVMAWLLALYLFKKIWHQTDNTPVEERVTIPISIWIWIVSMLVMVFAVIMGHYDYDFTIIETIKSLIKFGKAWALFALFPLIGCLKIRPQLISRAVCIIGIQSLLFIPICYIAKVLELTTPLYVSPLSRLGGTPLLYTINLYAFDYGKARIFLFAPWGPVLGLVACLYFFIACLEKDQGWRWIGITAAVAMAWVSGSRAAIVCLLTIPCLSWFLANLAKFKLQISAAIGCFCAGLIGTQLLDWSIAFKENFYAQRAKSSQTREILGNIALYRWWNEAPIWGHAVVEVRGPSVVEHYPVGSHHTWFSLLFLHGIVGAIAFAYPMLWSFIELLIKAQKSTVAWVGLGIILVLFTFCFVEKLDYVAYIFWPALVMLGIALKEEVAVKKSMAAREIQLQ